jgi:hypothetical protein
LCALQSRGFHLFPLQPGKKTPRVAGWTTQLDGWDFNPEDNIGVYTGAFGDGALIVVDIDNKDGRDGGQTIVGLEIEGHELPPTYEVATPSGGRHLYYQAPSAVPSGVDVLGPGVDIRSAGGYVVGAGSRLAGFAQRYVAKLGDGVDPQQPIAVAPQWLFDICGKPREREPRKEVEPLTGYAAEVAHAKAQRYLQYEAPEAIEGAGGDALTYQVACRVRDFGVSQDDALGLMLGNWNDRCQPPWTSDDLGAKVSHAYRYATGTLGKDNPATIFEPVATAKPATPDCRYKLESVADLLQRPPPRWLVRGMVPESGLVMVYGAPGCGKTFLTLDMAASIARGEAWAGRRTRKGRVVYVGLEGHMSVRVAAHVKARGIGADALAGFQVIERQPLNMREAKDVVALARDIRAASPEACSLLVVDTLNRAMQGGDENDSSDMGLFIYSANYLANELGCAVCIVHHSGKAESAGARGHSSLHGAADAEISVSAREGVHVFEIAKAKDGIDGERFAFELRTVDIGMARDTDPEADADEKVTSCSVEAVRPIERKEKTVPVRLGASAQNLVTAIQTVLAGQALDKDAPFEDAAVPIDEVRVEFERMHAGDPRARQKFFDAKTQLQAKKCVKLRSDGRIELTHQERA